VENLQDPFYNESTRLSKAAKVQSLLYSIVPNGPRIDWKLAVVEELSIGGDDLVRAANMRLLPTGQL